MTEKSSGEDSLLPRDALGHVAMGLHSLAVQQGSSCPVSSVSRVVYQIAQEKQPTSFGVFFFFLLFAISCHYKQDFTSSVYTFSLCTPITKENSITQTTLKTEPYEVRSNIK